MKNCFIKFRKELAFLLLTAIVISMVIPAVNTYADSQQFSINVTIGYDTKQEVDVHVPITVEVTNGGSDFEGTIRMTVPSRNGNIMCEQALSLAKGATKKITMAPEFYFSGYNVRVSIVNKKGKTVFYRDIRTNVSYSRNYVRVGILSDDSSAAKLLDDKSFTCSSYGAIYLNTVDLSGDNIYEKAEYMDSLDAIVITNFSTDVLSEKQIQALISWAANGGLLIIGTGDSYKKTLSGFENVLEYKDNGVSKYSTDYAIDAVTGEISNIFADEYSNKVKDLFSMNFSSIMQVIDCFKMTSTTSEAVYNKMTAAIDDAVKDDGVICTDDFFDVLWSECALEIADQIYYSVEWYDDLYYLNDFEVMHEEAKNGNYEAQYMMFKTYCSQVLLPAVAAEYLLANYNMGIEEALQYVCHNQDELQSDVEYGQGSTYEYVDADLWNFAFGDSAFKDTDKNTGKEISVFQYESYGDGYIVLAAMDFSKKPFTTVSYNSELLTSVIEVFIGDAADQRNQSYDSSVYGGFTPDYYSELLTNLQTTTPVPVLIYFMVFGVYIAGCFILYGLLKKKKKSLLLWPIIAGAAVVASVLVYFISFSTKSVKPTLNAVKIVDAGDTSGKVDIYCTVTLPKAKLYKVTFTEGLSIDCPDFYEYDYLSFSDLSGYSLGFSETEDGQNRVLFNNTGVQTTEYLVVTDNSFEHGDILFKGTYSNAVLSGYITNNYGYDLTNCCILLDSCVVPIGTLKNGETIDLSTLTLVATFDPSYWTSPQTTRKEAVFGKETTWKTIMLGIGGRDIVKKNSKKAAMDYLIEKKEIPNLLYSSYNSNTLNADYLPIFTTGSMYFVGYNARTEGLTESGATEITTEMVYKEAEQ